MKVMRRTWFMIYLQSTNISDAYDFRITSKRSRYTYVRLRFIFNFIISISFRTFRSFAFSLAHASRKKYANKINNDRNRRRHTPVALRRNMDTKWNMNVIFMTLTRFNIVERLMFYARAFQAFRVQIHCTHYYCEFDFFRTKSIWCVLFQQINYIKLCEMLHQRLNLIPRCFFFAVAWCPELNVCGTGKSYILRPG